MVLIDLSVSSSRHGQHDEAKATRINLAQSELVKR